MKEEVKKLIEKISKDPELKKKFNNIKTEDEFLSVAKENGFNITKDELNFDKNELENGLKLSNDELEKVVGGSGFCLCDAGGNGVINIRTPFHNSTAYCICSASGVGIDPMDNTEICCECQSMGTGCEGGAPF